MEKIESLTAQQEERLLEFRQQGLEIGLSTREADRPATEATLADFYQRIGQRKPVFWWVESPLQANLIIAILKNGIVANLGNNLRANLVANLVDNLRDNLVANLRDNLVANLVDNLMDNLGNNLRANLRANLRNNLRANLRANLMDNLVANLVDNLGNNLGNNFTPCYFWGSLDAYWIAFYLFPHEELRPIHTKEQIAILRGWETLAKSCFWWYPFMNICVVSNRPSVIAKDSEMRLHNESGPAFTFRDGWQGYYWRGINVPEFIIERPHDITVPFIETLTNAEVRRVSIERYGVARYLEDSNAKPIHADQYGTLYRKEIANDEPLVMVKVLNATPEPDGHFKSYFLRVPPDMQTARQAVAWTFDLKPEEYHPLLKVNGETTVRKIVLTFALMLVAAQAHATDWCGKTIPGGISASTIKVTTLDQHQNCAGRAGIRLPSYSQLNLNGYTISDATGSCVRSIGTRYVAMRNGWVQGCGSDGIDLNGVYRPALSYLTANNNAASGIRCASCEKLTLTQSTTTGNGANGLKIENGINNNVSYHVAQSNPYGIRLVATIDGVVYSGYQHGNFTRDVIFEQESFDCRAYGGSRGHVYFATGAFNNWTSHYVTCKSDGSGHGSNQCR